MATAKTSKKTIHIDPDEEITGIIDKVRSADENILALVLPKRASMMQSVVNMKLLKRAADHSDKKVVLITSEQSLLPLAGTAGLHVAATLQSRPTIPTLEDAKRVISAPQSIADPKTAIGDLAETTSKKSADPIEIDNTPQTATPAVTAQPKAKKPAKDKNKMVPNFQKFRVLLFAGGAALVLLIIGLYWALALAPKATVTLRTEASETSAQASFTADTDQDELDEANKVVPAKKKELKKTETEKVATTGTKDQGAKATGSVSLRNCTDNKVNIPAGTGISNGSLTFITQSAVNLAEGEFTSNGQCRQSGDHVGDTKVVAQENGDQYNLSPRSYTVASFSGVVAQGDQMSGGSSKTIRVVSQADIDTAKKRISDRQNSVVEQLKTELEDDGYVGLVDSFTTTAPNYTPTPALDAEATEVSVSAEVTYTMIGIKEDNLKNILLSESKDSIDTTKQSVLSYGFDEATFEVGKTTGTLTPVSVNTTLLTGPEIDEETIKADIAGSSSSEASGTLKERPGITDARVELKPFWVKSVPKKASKVTLIVEQANGKQITD
jgi:hypothetical protein